MIIIEFKDGPNKGKQVVFPTPDYSKPAPEIDTIDLNEDPNTQEYNEAVAYFKDQLLRTSMIPRDRFVPEKPSLWKRFTNLFRWPR